ncbi:MAG: protein tyrosine phosphatase family protein [Anaerolineales bacterium]
MPTPDQISSIAQADMKVVINLATLKSEGAVPNEKELVEAQNMLYYNIPVEWNQPTAQDLQEFFRIMDKHQDEKVFVHCQANYRATGFITLYRILRLGWDKETAFADMNKIWNPEDFPVWEKFIQEQIESK